MSELDSNIAANIANLQELVKKTEYKDLAIQILDDAKKHMSQRNFLQYTNTALAIASIGKGLPIVIKFLEVTPQITNTIEAEIIKDTQKLVVELASITSSNVIELVLSSLPLASSKIKDYDLLNQYFRLIYLIASKAIRGLRPMLENIDLLFQKLTMSGLRRWAMWGADAHARDYKAQLAYFSLQSQDSLAVIKQQHKGVLFINTHRNINFFLRAFWGRDFFIRPTATDVENFKPFYENLAIHLPEALDEITINENEEKPLLDAKDIYRAMAVHQVAHLVYSNEAVSLENLTPTQMFFIELIEDARVEYFIFQKFPGLKKLFINILHYYHSETINKKYTDTIKELFIQLVYALMNFEYQIAESRLHNFIAKARNKLANNFKNQNHNKSSKYQQHISWNLGLDLYNMINNLNIRIPNLSILKQIDLVYRDDNRLIWSSDEWQAIENQQWFDELKPVRKNVNLMEFINEIDSELETDEHQETWILNTELFPYEDMGKSYNEMEGKEAISAPFHYDEWDYKVQLAKPSWTTLYEHKAKKDDPKIIDDIILANKPILTKIRNIIDRLQPQGLVRIRPIEDGDELYINAVVEAITAIRMGKNPDPRITQRTVIHNRDLAVYLLLDLSESTNDKVPLSDKTILDIIKQASSLVATAIEGIGDAYAIGGFASNGKHDVRFTKFKEFKEDFNKEVKANLAGMIGGLSTRLGVAMRHAGYYLQQRSENKKLLLVLTDGEPADIDEQDTQYLKADSKKAVEELTTKGIYSYCLTIDQFADKYVQKIFGSNHFAIVDKVDKLPETLPKLFANLTVK